MKKYLIILVVCLLCGCEKENIVSRNLFYMDTVINIKIYESDKKADSAINYIEQLYKKYQDITNFYDQNSELYQINNNQIESETLFISPELYKLIENGLIWGKKSNGLLNINIGNLTKTWHDFREGLISFPTEDLLDVDISIDNIKLLDNHQIMNDDFNIDLGSLVKGYVTELAGQYLEEVGLNKYIINAGGNVKVGASIKGYYNIGIASPNQNDTLLVIKGENISVVTSGGYERFQEHNGILYHHIIDPNTKYPADHLKSVTVIGKDSGECDALSTILFLMDITKGKEFIKDYAVDVIWYTNDNQIIKSDGFKYE